MAKISAKAKEIRDTVMKTPSPRESLHITTGNDLMDIMFGAGKGYGIESAQMIGIYASPSSGKTALCNDVIANCKFTFGDKLKHRYVDLEDGNHFDFMSMYGFNIIEDEERSSYPRTIEKWSTDVIEFMEALKDDEFGIYVMDSFDLLVAQDVVDTMDARRKAHKDNKDFDKGSYGVTKQKYTKGSTVPFLRELSYRKNCIIIVIMQVIDNIGGGSFDKKQISTGGNALTHMFDTKLFMARREDIKKGTQKIGHTVKITSEKLRGPLLKWECMLHFFGVYGFDNISSSLAYLFDLYTDGNELQVNREISWNGISDSVENIKKFMNDNEYIEEFKKDFKTSSPKDVYITWITSDAERRNKYEQTFGTPMKLQELIMYIESNNLEEELTNRVREKQMNEWKVANSVFDGRKPRFQKVANANT